jgi:hypothetical protein
MYHLARLRGGSGTTAGAAALRCGGRGATGDGCMGRDLTRGVPSRDQTRPLYLLCDDDASRREVIDSALFAVFARYSPNASARHRAQEFGIRPRLVEFVEQKFD